MGPRLAHVDVRGSAVAFLLQFFMLCRLLPPSRSSFYGGGWVMSSAPRVALGAGHRQLKLCIPPRLAVSCSSAL